MSTVILAGCNSGSKSTKKKSSSSSQPDSSEVTPVNPAPPIDDHEGTPGEGDVADKHITGISMKYTKDFFMQNKTTLDFSVTFKGGGGDDEKGIDWTSTNPYVLGVEVNQSKTSQCVLTGLKEGTSRLIAQSTYNRSLTAQVTITVIDNSDYTYFWQMNKTGPNKNDNDQFNGLDDKPLSEGTVTFSGKEWAFHIDTPTIKVGGGQMLKFGSAKAPSGNVTLSTSNDKYIRRISVMCSSAAAFSGEYVNGHAKKQDVGSSCLTVTVGNTKYIDNVPTPKGSDDEADAMTGEEYNDKALTGDIKISFSPTYEDPITKINSGAIYLKSIIIEYYRGDLQKIEVDSELSEHSTKFFVGTAFNSLGIVVNAFFSESPSTKVDVSHLATFNTPNLDKDNRFTEEAENQDVSVSYSFKKNSSTIQTQETSYSIIVYKKVSSVTIGGSLKEGNDEYLLYEEMKYEGLVVQLNADGEEAPILTYPLENYKNDDFKREFDIDSVHDYATKTLQNGFKITVKHKLSGKSGSKTFEKNEITVKLVSKIEVIYKDGNTPYAPSLTAGEVMDYKEFNAKITYDNDSSKTLTFTELNQQKYNDPSDGFKSKNRFDYKKDTPLVVAKSMQTEGFNIVVSSSLDNVSGTLNIPANQVSVKAIQSIDVNGAGLTTTEYNEHDLMNYTGVTITLNYDDGTSETLSYADAKNAVRYEKVADKDTYKTQSKPLFNFNFPEEALLDMTSGFTISINLTESEAIVGSYSFGANAITVSKYVAKTYTRVESNADFDAAGDYIIVHKDPDDSSKMKVWDGSLAYDKVIEGGPNSIDYSHPDGEIGKTLTIDVASVERAAFHIEKLSETFEVDSQTTINLVTVYLKNTIGTSTVRKMTINTDSASFVKTTNGQNGNADRQKLLTLFDEDHNVLLGKNQVFLYFNKSSQRFKASKSTINTLPVQIYKIGA